MTDPVAPRSDLPWWWTADTEDDDHWNSEFGGEDIRALVRERNRLLAARRGDLRALSEAVRVLPPVINSAPWHYIDRAAVLALIEGPAALADRA